MRRKEGSLRGDSDEKQENEEKRSNKEDAMATKRGKDEVLGNMIWEEKQVE